MRISITHKDQEVERVVAPANLFLEQEGHHRVCGDGQAQIEDCAASHSARTAHPSLSI